MIFRFFPQKMSILIFFAQKVGNTLVFVYFLFFRVFFAPNPLKNRFLGFPLNKFPFLDFFVPRVGTALFLHIQGSFGVFQPLAP